jgi:siroheme synthase-like protein
MPPSEAERKGRKTRFLPIAVDVLGRKVVVIGGGKIALQKLKTIMLFSPRVTVVAPEILPEIKAMPLECLYQAYDSAQLDGAALVYACTSDKEANRLIGRDAAQKGILCNVADDIEACAFISPAVMVEDDLVVAVNSQGRAPSLAKDARDFIKDRIHEFLHGRH